MPTLHLLGTGAALTDPHRHTTMLAFSDGASTFVIDCGGDVVQRMLAAGLDLNTLSGLFITHEHPDHVSGFPLFIEKIWLSGRKAPLPVYGIAPALEQAWRCLSAFNIGHWDIPELLWREIDLAEGAPVFEDAAWRVTASPGVHTVPVTGVRVESKASGGAVVYSGDTEPCESIARLARGANLLVHEANGPGYGHTSPVDAARIAARAGVERLLLTHLPPGLSDADLTDARRHFARTELAEELDTRAF
ncbi:MBL fold metallo-hydrolase [Rhodocaloribacter litoris]|uniref:MBL fold metallo-hydrolase n=1 Tax=Rhodocaloribacter litoris TaxID=2558931 RepID=UPI00141F16C0|nr:MBL fold metallo-hydrolase [Rhodocaloribacter litoris]QXD15014.1 MBL fold metallo-hydrolase [Rhodocaloribacter litoris]GIV62194.1 MAG: MBL fold metallo-hydrolase [Rhodothermaceae bacterium]